jgi:hydroxyacylglutathione hydrolase
VISERAGLAALIDPLRDVDTYVAAAQAEGVRISHVFETHLHNDFVSGSRELASRTGARIVASADAGLQFEHQPVRDGDTITVGDVRFSILATPGHTPEHVSFLAEDLAASSQTRVLFSGGSLLVGAVSRTDLLGHEHATGLAHQLYHSLHEKILPLEDDVVVYPTHGAGSFCTAAPGGARTTTIGQERWTNHLLELSTPEAFAQTLLSSMPTYPRYFDHMRALNQRGPRVLGHVPRLPGLSPTDVRDRQSRGEAVVDLRPVRQYVEGHIPGVYHVQLRPVFGSWVGWVVPFGTPVILVTETGEAPEDAVRQLIRIDYDELPGFLDGGMAAWRRAGLPLERAALLTMRDLRDRIRRGEPLVVLDVRQPHEWPTGHLPEAVLLEAGELPRADLHLPHDRLLATHCGHGERAATALSVLERRGYRQLGLVTGGVGDWREAGGAVVTDGGPVHA